MFKLVVESMEEDDYANVNSFDEEEEEKADDEENQVISKQEKKQPERQVMQCSTCEEQLDKTEAVCQLCSRWYHETCAVGFKNPWYCLKCTSYAFYDHLGIFPGQKHGPDIWTYLEGVPLAIQIKCHNRPIALAGYCEALRSLHPYHWWSLGTSDSFCLRSKWRNVWQDRPFMFYRYVRVW